MEWITKKKKDKTVWNKWFAWYPVIVETYSDGRKKKVWLEYISRRNVFPESRNCLYPYPKKRGITEHEKI